MTCDGLHQLHSRMSTKWPSIAAAAAICGRDEVRAPAAALAALEVAVGGRGAALARLQDVRVHAQAHRAAGLAPVEAGGAEDLVEALRLGLRLHLLRSRARPSRRRRGDLAARRRPRAAARRSPIREFVHEPMNTRSSVISSIGVPGSSAMYVERALARSSRRGGSGTAPGDRRRPWPGFVPQVTSGESAAASTSISRVERRAVVGAQLAPALDAPRRSPPARRGRPSTHSNVVSSGAIMPARPPPSIVMLQIVIRPSIESASIDRAGVLDDVAGRAVGAHLADRAEDQVLGGDAEAELARRR